MPNQHPSITIAGIILGIAVCVLTFVGLSCSAYSMDPVQNAWTKPAMEFGVSMKMCK